MQEVQFWSQKIVGTEFVLEQLQKFIVAIIVQKWEVVIVVPIQKKLFDDEQISSTCTYFKITGRQCVKQS